MLGIKDIAVSFPEARQSNLEAALRLGVDEDFVRTKIGVIERPVLDAGQDTSDLAASALRSLLTRQGLEPDAVEALVVVTQNPDSRLPMVAGLVHAKCGLRTQCAAFDIALGCSGYVYGLSVLQAFMQANGLRCGVLVTCDPYSKIIDQYDKNTVLLFGDAATATLITNEALLAVSGFTFGTAGDAEGALVEKGGTLRMKGREVFNFAATRVPESIAATLSLTGMAREDVDAYLLHQGSRYIVETVARRAALPPGAVRIGLTRTGNTVSSSIPILLADELGNPAVRTILLSGFGVGLSWASCLCRRIQGEK